MSKNTQVRIYATFLIILLIISSGIILSNLTTNKQKVNHYRIAQEMIEAAQKTGEFDPDNLKTLEKHINKSSSSYIALGTNKTELRGLVKKHCLILAKFYSLMTRHTGGIMKLCKIFLNREN